MLQTIVLKVDPEDPDVEIIRAAAGVIRRRGLVAFPTETVYGLGGNALDDIAARKIFEAKGRPTDNPLIVHVASKDEVQLLAERVPEEAEELIAEFWPGPLTILLKRSELVADAVTCGLDTVAIRMPNHAVALALIRESGVPIAAPSANLAGRPSPTTAGHVSADLAGRIDMILDGGEVGFGLESTVLDLIASTPTILRPGPVTLEELRRVLGEVRVHPGAKSDVSAEEMVARSPGMKYHHYAPAASVILVEGPTEKVVRKICELARAASSEGKRVRIMATEETKEEYPPGLAVAVGSLADLRTVAKGLFATLRSLDEQGADLILAEGIEEVGIGLAIMNRLRKAAEQNIILV